MTSTTLMLTALTVFVIAASASADPVLARLSRISRGEWVAPKGLPRAYVPYETAIRSAAHRYGLRTSLLAALVRAESAFNPRAVSRVGARGLGQLMPATARDLGVRDSFDPQQNLDGAARYLSVQLHALGSVPLALAAYHAGPERARLGLSRVPRVTRTYVARVMRFEREYRERGLTN